MFKFCPFFLPFPPPTNVGPAVGFFSASKQNWYICEDDVFLAANIDTWRKGRGEKRGDILIVNCYFMMCNNFVLFCPKLRVADKKISVINRMHYKFESFIAKWSLVRVCVLVFAGINRSELRNRKQSTVYLITYSRVDLSKVPKRQAFVDIVVKAFEQLDLAKVAHWVVSQENHADSESEPLFGKHYHLAIKLTRRARWCRVRAQLHPTMVSEFEARNVLQCLSICHKRRPAFPGFRRTSWAC